MFTPWIGTNERDIEGSGVRNRCWRDQDPEDYRQIERRAGDSDKGIFVLCGQFLTWPLLY